MPEGNLPAHLAGAAARREALVAKFADIVQQLLPPEPEANEIETLRALVAIQQERFTRLVHLYESEQDPGDDRTIESWRPDWVREMLSDLDAQGALNEVTALRAENYRLDAELEVLAGKQGALVTEAKALRARLAKLDEMLASEEPPEGLEAAVAMIDVDTQLDPQARGGHTYIHDASGKYLFRLSINDNESHVTLLLMAYNSGLDAGRTAAWRWFREQLVPPAYVGVDIGSSPGFTVERAATAPPAEPEGETNVEHLELCPGCDRCDGLIDNGWQTCERCHQWGNDMTSLPPGIAVCNQCLEAEPEGERPREFFDHGFDRQEPAPRQPAELETHIPWPEVDTCGAGTDGECDLPDCPQGINYQPRCPRAGRERFEADEDAER